MIRNRISMAIAVTLVAALAVTACNKKEEAAPAPAPVSAPAPTPAPAPVAATPAPAPTVGILTSIDLGSAIGADNKISTPATTFAATDTIHASVVTDGAGGKINATWTYQDGQTVQSQDKAAMAGTQVSEFSISKPDGWPVGKYTLTVTLDGVPPQTREFEVK